VPQEIVGDWAPSPRKLKPASAIMLLPTPIVAVTMTGPSAFGRMWRKRIAPCPTPRARAAWTWSRSLSDSVSPRTTRAIVVQPSAVSTTATLSSPGRSNTAMSPMARISEGNAITTSVIRIRAESRQPP
jgi:hypothetical protein